jgi:hypothetical protein
VHHSPPSSTKGKNTWSCTYTPSYHFLVGCLIRYFERYAQSKSVLILSLTLYLQAAESAICRQVMTSSQEQDHCATSGGVRCVCWCGKSCDHHGASETRGRSEKKKVQIKERAVKRRKILPCGFLREKRTEQNEGPTLFQVRLIHYVITARLPGTTYTRTLSQLIFQVRHIPVRYHSSSFSYNIYPYVIPARISVTTYTRTLSQLVFQVRHIHVRYHSSYFRYDIYTYVITARISGTTHTRTLSQLVFQVRHIHVRYHSSCFRYDIHTYVIAAHILGMTYAPMSSQLVLQVHVHVCYHSLHFRYGIYTYVITSCMSGTTYIYVTIACI